MKNLLTMKNVGYACVTGVVYIVLSTLPFVGVHGALLVFGVFGLQFIKNVLFSDKWFLKDPLSDMRVTVVETGMFLVLYYVIFHHLVIAKADPIITIFGYTLVGTGDVEVMLPSLLLLGFSTISQILLNLFRSVEFKNFLKKENMAELAAKVVKTQRESENKAEA